MTQLAWLRGDDNGFTHLSHIFPRTVTSALSPRVTQLFVCEWQAFVDEFMRVLSEKFHLNEHCESFPSITHGYFPFSVKMLRFTAHRQ
jgi:hypothetical protein